MELFLSTLDLLHLEHIESHCLAQRPALAYCHQVSQLNISVATREITPALAIIILYKKTNQNIMNEH